MQRTTKMMFDHYMARNRALDVVWMRKRRRHILFGSYYFAKLKAYHVYTGDPLEMLGRQQDYPSPLFDRARETADTLISNGFF